jgi:hypothetical protein
MATDILDRGKLMGSRFREAVRFSVATAAAGLFMLAAATALAWATDIPLEDLGADPNVVAGESFSVGVLTRVEVLVWSVAVGIALAAGLLGRRWSAPQAPVLLAFGGVAAVLVADDALLIHEAATKAGVPRGSFQAIYGAAVLLLLWRFRVPLFSVTPWILLIVACGWLGLSAIVDAVVDYFVESSALHVVEDGLKLFGILTWSLYLVLTSRDLGLSLPRVLRNSPAHQPDQAALAGEVDSVRVAGTGSLKR